MAYCAKADLTQRFGAEIDQLLDRDNDGTEDAGIFDATTADADSIINGYLASRYTLPLSSTPALLKQIACDIVRYLLWDDRAPEEVRKRYDDAMGKLRDIGRGLIALVLDGGSSTTTSGASVATTSRTRQFSDTTLSGFVGD